MLEGDHYFTKDLCSCPAGLQVFYGKFLAADYKAFSYHMTIGLVQVSKLCLFLLSFDHRLQIVQQLESYHCSGTVP